MHQVLCSKEFSEEKSQEFCELTGDKYFLELHISNIRRIAETEFINSFHGSISVQSSASV